MPRSTGGTGCRLADCMDEMNIILNEEHKLFFLTRSENQ